MKIFPLDRVEEDNSLSTLFNPYLSDPRNVCNSPGQDTRGLKGNSKHKTRRGNEGFTHRENIS